MHQLTGWLRRNKCRIAKCQPPRAILMTFTLQQNDQNGSGSKILRIPKKASKQANKETNKRTKKQRNKHTNKETKKQRNKQPTNQPNKKTNKQTNKHDIYQKQPKIKSLHLDQSQVIFCWPIGNQVNSEGFYHGLPLRKVMVPNCARFCNV